jgi:hypothetical protein
MGRLRLEYTTEIAGKTFGPRNEEEALFTPMK